LRNAKKQNLLPHLNLLHHDHILFDITTKKKTMNALLTLLFLALFPKDVLGVKVSTIHSIADDICDFVPSDLTPPLFISSGTTLSCEYGRRSDSP
jgi:hypothetical protein